MNTRDCAELPELHTIISMVDKVNLTSTTTQHRGMLHGDRLGALLEDRYNNKGLISAKLDLNP